MSWTIFGIYFGIFAVCFIGGFLVGYIVALLANWMFKPNSQDYMLYYRMYHDVINKDNEEEDK
jgi:membrane-associated phospholipid phosphatase